MHIGGIIEDDIVDCDSGVAVSLFTAGCPHKCKGCHNANLWDYNFGEDENIIDIIDRIVYLIGKNDIERNFSVLGGEPLCPENLKDVSTIIRAVREKYPNIRIYVWTGYEYEDLPLDSAEMKTILHDIDVLIDGPYIEDLRDTRLKLRGSSNQHIRLQRNGFAIEEDNDIIQ